MAGIFDNLEERVMSPMVLGGMGLAFSGMPGLQAGMQSGMAFGKQRRENQQRQMFAQALDGALQDPRFASMSPAERQMLAANPEMAQGIFSDIYKHQFDPMAKLREQSIRHGMSHQDATLAETKRWHDMQLQRQAADPYGKAGTILQGADGRYYSVQFGSGGQRKIEPLAVGENALKPARGVDVAGNIIYDKSDGREVRDISQNLQAGEQAKVTGREVAEARVKASSDLPRVEDNARFMLDTIEKLKKHPGEGAGTGPLAGRLPQIGGDQAGYVALADQLQGKAFLEAFNSLRGGGHITEIEGKKGTDAISRFSRVQNKRDRDAALADLTDVVNAGMKRARASAGGAPQASGSGPVRVNSPDEAARLPSGTEFIAPDGRIRRVP